MSLRQEKLELIKDYIKKDIETENLLKPFVLTLEELKFLKVPRIQKMKIVCSH